MNNINVKTMGIAFGLTGALLYLGCMISMTAIGGGAINHFFDNFFPPTNVLLTLRTNIPLWKVAVGMLPAFLLFGFTGFCIAGIYNKMLPKKSKSIY